MPAAPKKKQNTLEGDAQDLLAPAAKKKKRNTPEDDAEDLLAPAAQKKKQNTSEHDEEDLLFFRHAAKKIKRAKSFADLEHVVKDLRPLITELPSPCPTFTMEEVFLGEDKESALLIPAEHQDKAAVDIFADGNCLPRCLSLLHYGYQSRSEEMRVRVVVELVSFWWQYLDGEFMVRGYEQAPEDTSEYVNRLTMYCEDGVDGEERLKKHIFQARSDGAYCGIFHIAAAATVLKREVNSVYPCYGGHNVIKDINRVFLPAGDHAHPVQSHILWTHTEGVAMEPASWKPNHFVLLLPKRRSVYIVISSVYSHYIYTRYVLLKGK